MTFPCEEEAVSEESKLRVEIRNFQTCRIILFENGVVPGCQPSPNFQVIRGTPIKVPVNFDVPVAGYHLIIQSWRKFEIRFYRIAEERRAKTD